MLATVGDLVEDVVVRLAGPIEVAADTAATITRRQGGSAANVAVAAARAGRASRFLGQVGTDAIGAALLGEMAAAGVDVDHVRRGGTTGTIVALVDHTGERSMLTDRRACVELADPDPSWLDGVGVLHVPLYSLCAGPLADTAATLTSWAHDNGVVVSVDVSSHSVMVDLGLDRVGALLDGLRPGVVFANRDEAALLDLDGDASGAGVGGATVVVKRGADPALVRVPGSAPITVAAVPLGAVADTTGAGDAFAAGFLTHRAPDGGDWRADPTGACTAGHRSAAALLGSRGGTVGAAGLTSRASS